MGYEELGTTSADGNKENPDNTPNAHQVFSAGGIEGADTEVPTVAPVKPAQQVFEEAPAGQSAEPAVEPVTDSAIEEALLKAWQ